MNDNQTSNVSWLETPILWYSRAELQEKEAARLSEEQRLLLDYYGIPNGICRNRHERRKAEKLLKINRVRLHD